MGARVLIVLTLAIVPQIIPISRISSGFIATVADLKRGL
jgi:hypothetical protein